MNKKYFSYTILISTMLFILMIGFMWFVDPLNVTSSPKFGFNKRISTEEFDRQYKALHLHKLQLQYLIVGTSRTRVGIDAGNPYFLKWSTYNAAIAAAKPSEINVLCNEAIKNGVTHILYGVDFFVFYQDGSDENMIKQGLKDFFLIPNFYLTTKMFRQTLNDLFNKGPYIYDKTGTDNPAWDAYINTQVGGYRSAFHGSEHQFYVDNYTKQFDANATKQWQAFEKNLDLAYKNNIDVILFIPPAHVRQWEVLSLARGWKSFEDFKKKLIEINEYEAKKFGKPSFVIWDFADYNALSSEEISADKTVPMKWYWHSSHFKKELGNIVLDRIFDGNYSGGQNYPYFGEKINSQNIEEHLKKIREDRAQWQHSHQKDVAEIEALKNKAR